MFYSSQHPPKTGTLVSNTSIEQAQTIEVINPNQELETDLFEGMEGFTRIDFLHFASRRYINGGWLRILSDTYIQPVNSNEQYKLIRAINIPIAPTKHYFQRQGQSHFYTLIFSALPKDTAKINIIESEAPGNYFNFYGLDYAQWMFVSQQPR